MIRRLLHVVLLIAIGPSLAAAATPVPATQPVYVPRNVQWRLNDQVANVQAVFPHPQISDTIYLSTSDGLLRSSDGGKIFAPLKHASAETIGIVTDIAFRGDQPEHLTIATQGHGIWTSDDGGQTVKTLATKASGLASDSVKGIFYESTDRLLRTLLAIHGEDAPGLSRSTDNGKTWQILFPDQHVYQIFWLHQTSKQLLLESAPAKDPNSRTVYFLSSLQEPWQKMLDDVYVTGAAVPGGKYESVIFLSTADKGIFRIAREGGIIKNADSAGAMKWASLNTTWGQNPKQRVIYAYEPTKLGMVLFSPDKLAGDTDAETSDSAPTYQTMSEGLFTGELVMDGAHIRASADGATFYAAVNRTLYESSPTSDRLSISHVNLTPAALLPQMDKITAARAEFTNDLSAFNSSHHLSNAARDLQPKLDSHLKEWRAQRVVITAEVRSTPDDPVESVTANLQRFRLPPKVPLFDDGRHDDGKAGDGIYGNHFVVDFTTIRADGTEAGTAAPESNPIAISAVTKKQLLAGAVGTLTLAAKQDAVPFVMLGPPIAISGDLTGARLREEKPFRWLYTINVKSPGDWSVLMHCGYGNHTVDITGQEVMSFWIRASHESTAELTLQLRDTPTYSRAARSQPVNLMAEGFIPNGKLTTTDTRVQIPVSRLIKDAGEFQPSITGAMILTSKAEKPLLLTIHHVQFQPVSSEPDDNDSKAAE